MPLYLEILLPNKKPAKVWAGNVMTLVQAQKILELEKCDWKSMTKPHVTQNSYTWDIEFSDGDPERVTLPAGSSILFSYNHF